jgi:hypothetical protein
MFSPPHGDSIDLRIIIRCVREAHTIQAASAFNIHLLPDEDSRLLFQYVSHIIQQEPNARINRARRTDGTRKSRG